MMRRDMRTGAEARAVASTLALIAIGTLLAFATNLLIGTVFEGVSRDLRVALGYIALGLPLLIAERAQPARLGFPRARLRTATAVGVALALATLLGAGIAATFAGGISPDLASPLAMFTVVAVVEEGMFRGALQSRLIAWIGRVHGLIATALCFTVWHLPQRLLSGTAGADLVVSLLIVLAIGSAFGLLMLAVRNAIGPTIWHVAIDLIDRL